MPADIRIPIIPSFPGFLMIHIYSKEIHTYVLMYVYVSTLIIKQYC